MERNVLLKAWRREWFYYIDHKGMLYCEDTHPKNFTSCLKDDRFLDFFFGNIKANDTGAFQEYPYVSPCWGELNFIKAFRFPIVFRNMTDKKLLYAGTKSVEFDPTKLAYDQNDILLFKLNDTQYANFDTSLAVELSENMLVEDDELKFQWQGATYRIDKVLL